MDTVDNTSAQRRSDQIDAFNRELTELERDKVLQLSSVQRQTIHDYHQKLFNQFRQSFDIDSSQQDSQLSLGMRIASFLGALALSASVFFLFYQFWGKLATTSQIVILIGASVISFIATIVVAGKDTSGYFTKLVALVSFACFVLNLVLFGQIFNITPTDNALIVWAAYALLLAYAFKIRLLQVAGVLCLIAFVSARVGSWSGIYWIHFGERPENFFPIAIALFFLPQWVDHSRFSGFALSYRVFGMVTFFIALLILSHWGYGSYLQIDPGTIEIIYQFLGFSLSAACIAYGIRRGWAHVVNTGVVFFVIFLYTKVFDWWWELMPKYLFFFILALIAILCLLVMQRLRKAGRQNRVDVA